MFKVIDAFDCKCEQCSHQWKAFYMPDRCAGCKARTWDKSKVPQAHQVASSRLKRQPASRKPVETPQHHQMPDRCIHRMESVCDDCKKTHKKK